MFLQQIRFHEILGEEEEKVGAATYEEVEQHRMQPEVAGTEVQLTK